MLKPVPEIVAWVMLIVARPPFETETACEPELPTVAVIAMVLGVTARNPRGSAYPAHPIVRGITAKAPTRTSGDRTPLARHSLIFIFTFLRPASDCHVTDDLGLLVGGDQTVFILASAHSTNNWWEVQIRDRYRT
jgi:hypothetical protein